MIAKVSSCKGGSALFAYVVNEQKGYELDRNFLSGQTPKEMYEEMKIIQNQNNRCVNNTFSMVISPSVKDGKKLSNDELKNITNDFLELMKKSPIRNQFIAFVHTEKDHKHIHIIMNRIQENGKPMADKFIGKKAQHAIDQVAQKYGLDSAKQLMVEKLNHQKLDHKKERDHIKDSHYDVMKSKPKSFENYQKAMKEKGIDVVPTINKQGNLQGFRFNNMKTGNSFKASEVDRKLNLKQLFHVKPLENKQSIKNDLNVFPTSVLTPNLLSQLNPKKVVKKVIKAITNDYSM